VLEQKNALLTRLYGASPMSVDEVYETYCQHADRLAPFVRETGVMIGNAMDNGEVVMFEGAQGTMLDLDLGTYPYVTAAVAGGVTLGRGAGSAKVDTILGVFKAYTTRVGGGPMPTELHDENGELIRERAHEYGTTTGRPRRCGWFDGVVGRYSTEVNGFTAAAITRFDILDVFSTLKICTSYEVGGVRFSRPPASADLLAKCQPVYEEMPGWQCPTSDIRHFEDLPAEARAYVKRVEELTDCPVALISVGPSREQTIVVKPLP
jgi:adenylosuccinate synthase